MEASRRNLLVQSLANRRDIREATGFAVIPAPESQQPGGAIWIDPYTTPDGKSAWSISYEIDERQWPFIKSETAEPDTPPPLDSMRLFRVADIGDESWTLYVPPIVYTTVSFGNPGKDIGPVFTTGQMYRSSLLYTWNLISEAVDDIRRVFLMIPQTGTLYVEQADDDVDLDVSEAVLYFREPKVDVVEFNVFKPEHEIYGIRSRPSRIAGDTLSSIKLQLLTILPNKMTMFMDNIETMRRGDLMTGASEMLLAIHLELASRYIAELWISGHTGDQGSPLTTGDRKELARLIDIPAQRLVAFETHFANRRSDDLRSELVNLNIIPSHEIVYEDAGLHIIPSVDDYIRYAIETEIEHTRRPPPLVTSFTADEFASDDVRFAVLAFLSVLSSWGHIYYRILYGTDDGRQYAFDFAERRLILANIRSQIQDIQMPRGALVPSRLPDLTVKDVEKVVLELGGLFRSPDGHKRKRGKNGDESPEEHETSRELEEEEIEEKLLESDNSSSGVCASGVRIRNSRCRDMR